MNDAVKIMRFHDTKMLLKGRWDDVWQRGDIDSLVEVFSMAVDALEAARQLKEDALRRQLGKARVQLRKAREQLDERGGDVRGMDTVDLNRAARIGLISKEVHDVEQKRRAQDFSVRQLPQPIFGAGAVVSGFLPCGSRGCNVLVDLSLGSPYCAEHAKSVRPPRSYITPNLTAVNLDVQLEEATKLRDTLRLQLDDAELQLAVAEKRVKAFDAHVG